MVSFDVVTNPYEFCGILLGQFVFYVILTIYIEKKNTLLKERNWRSIFNFNSNQQGFTNLNEGL